MNRVEGLWELLHEFGIFTPEQFEEAYKKCPKIDITAFVPPAEPEESGGCKTA